jgi:hypothetical protein
MIEIGEDVLQVLDISMMDIGRYRIQTTMKTRMSFLSPGRVLRTSRDNKEQRNGLQKNIPSENWLKCKTLEYSTLLEKGRKVWQMVKVAIKQKPTSRFIIYRMFFDPFYKIITLRKYG